MWNRLVADSVAPDRKRLSKYAQEGVISYDTLLAHESYVKLFPAVGLLR